MSKFIATLVIAALMLTGVAVTFPGGTDSAAPAITRASYEEPVNVNAEPIAKSGDVAAATERTLDEAIDIALEHVGLTAGEVTDLVAKREIDDGNVEIDVDFRQGDTEYEITVDAGSGEVLEQDKDHEPAKPVETQPAETVPVETAPAVVELTADEAVAIALGHAGLAADEVTNLKTKREVDDGVPEFDIDFRSGDYEYDYTIHAETGKVLEWDKDYKPLKVAETQPVETVPVETEPAVVELTKEEVIAIALEHAGLTADDVTRVKSEYDVDDGTPEWEIEFRSGRMEYEYTIHAETGKILEWDKEMDD